MRHLSVRDRTIISITYANCASHVLTIDFAPNQEATSLLHGPVSDLLTEPFQRHLLDIRDCSNISRLSCFMQLLISISILLFSFYSTLSIVLYGAVEHWMSGALVSLGDMIGYMMKL